jgi:hypothetical protein
VPAIEEKEKKMRRPIAVTSILACLWTVVLCLTEAPPTHASVQQYNDRTAFTDTAASLTSIDFEGLASPGGFVLYPSGLALSGVSFHSSFR